MKPIESFLGSVRSRCKDIMAAMVLSSVISSCASLPAPAANQASNFDLQRPDVLRAIGRATFVMGEGSQSLDFGLMYAKQAGLRLDLHTSFGLHLASFTLQRNSWKLLLVNEQMMLNGDANDLEMMAASGGLMAMIGQAYAVAFPLIGPNDFDILDTSQSESGYVGTIPTANGQTTLHWSMAAGAISGATFQTGEHTLWHAKVITQTDTLVGTIPQQWQFFNHMNAPTSEIEIRKVEAAEDVSPALLRLRTPPGTKTLSFNQWLRQLDAMAEAAAREQAMQQKQQVTGHTEVPPSP